MTLVFILVTYYENYVSNYMPVEGIEAVYVDYDEKLLINKYAAISCIMPAAL